jgi:hypothetical protein
MYETAVLNAPINGMAYNVISSKLTVSKWQQIVVLYVGVDQGYVLIMSVEVCN